ncbi:MAG: BT4734/BF3469 family protein, partial [Opitutales bacterium]
MTNTPPTWANVNIGLGSTLSNASDNSHTAAEFLAQIAQGTYELEIDCIRDALMNEDTDEAQKQKVQLPSVTWSGTFSQRRAAALIAHTGILCVDIDHIDSFDDTTKLQQRIGADPHTAAVFRSPSGCGLNVLVLAEPVPANDNDHKKLFALVERHFLDTYSLPIDPACKDVSRLCFLSCDPQMIVNDAPVPFDWQTFDASATWEPQQVAQRPAVPAGVALKPGEDYDARGDFFGLLKAHGW